MKRADNVTDLLTTAETFRWPRKGDRLLKRSDDWTRSAGFIDQVCTREAHIWTGYVLAGAALIERRNSVGHNLGGDNQGARIASFRFVPERLSLHLLLSVAMPRIVHLPFPALENDRYDALTIAAVKDDVRVVKLALELGGNPKEITSRFDGTALIAAAHLGTRLWCRR
jgi:hypothetical protein